MRQILLLSFCLLVANLTANSQSKKELAAAKVKSSTEFTTKTQNGKTFTYKSTYEEYDKKGYPLLTAKYDESGNLVEKETFTYDKFQRVTMKTTYDAVNNTTERKTYTYNAYDMITSETEYDSLGKMLKKTAYTYNSDGNPALETTSDGAGNVLKKTTYAYNNKKLKTGKKTQNLGKNTESSKKWDYIYF